MTDDTNQKAKPVFHEGERALHRALGIEERLQSLGQKMIRDHMPDEHREFFATLPWIHLGVVDSNGHPWAIVRMGQPGFIASPDEYSLTVSSKPLPGEPGNLNFSEGAKISLVGVEFATRRRNRLNATIIETVNSMMSLKVDQSFGNCPKYIQRRDTKFVLDSAPTAASTIEARTKFHIRDLELINNADTLFIASRFSSLEDDKRAGVDINHRGGFPGFITVLDDVTLEFPDYVGNNFFNTMGNIQLDPRVGLQVFDLDSGALLNIQGNADIRNLEDSSLAQADTGRRVRVKVSSIVRANHAFPFQFTGPEYSPFLKRASKHQ